MSECVYQSRFISSINDVNAQQWDALFDSAYPFLKHAFLLSLEETGCTTSTSGWSPCHCIIESDETLVGVCVLYQKTHSYGEYVFDHGWADAYYRNGYEYYPKLVSAIPFTPATGPRLSIHSEHNKHDIVLLMEDALSVFVEEAGISSVHVLFPNANSQALLHRPNASLQWQKRTGCQFHWFNENFNSFDDFLATFSSRKRKNIKKERQKLAQNNLTIIVKTASEITLDQWQDFYVLYNQTYLKRSGRHGYLTSAFFESLTKNLGDNVAMCQVWRDNTMIAAALYFNDSETLYGRYWGAIEDVQGLHFEACYYQGIEYAIAKGLKRFDPGAQGEHKIQRGFTPIQTRSLHYIANQDFSEAIARFLEQEVKHTDAYINDARTYLPFKEGHELKPSTILS